MADERSPESIFLEYRAHIERMASLMARRNGLMGEDAADFQSWVVAKFIEEDYAPIRKFRGASSLSTYLTVVVAMLARDFRVQRRGRWRPSAAARRVGDLAVRLESLVYRSRYTLAEAGQLLRTAGATRLSDRELGQMLSQLPTRSPLRPIEVTTEVLAEVTAGDGSADAPITADENARELRRIEGMVDECIASFSEQDRIILRMRFCQDISVADIARMLGIEQKPLYRRIDSLLKDLRERLSDAGITAQQVRGLIDGEAE
jgi:RNA polymerase sigma factor for flagellar operon FliA